MIYAYFIAFALLVCAALAVAAYVEHRRDRMWADECAGGPLDEAAETFDMDAAVRQSRDLREWAAICDAVDRPHEPTPIHDDLAAERLRDALGDDDALAEWVGRGWPA